MTFFKPNFFVENCYWQNILQKNDLKYVIRIYKKKLVQNLYLTILRTFERTFLETFVNVHLAYFQKM